MKKRELRMGFVGISFECVFLVRKHKGLLFFNLAISGFLKAFYSHLFWTRFLGF